MTNTQRREKFNALQSHFFAGAEVGINTTEGAVDGTVEYVGWDHESETAFIAVRVPSRFAGYAIARMAPANTFRKS